MPELNKLPPDPRFEQLGDQLTFIEQTEDEIVRCKTRLDHITDKRLQRMVKTTLLRIIAGLDAPDSGTLELDGRSVLGVPPGRRGLGFVFQSYGLFEHMSVAANIGFGLNIRKPRIPRARIAATVERMLKLVQLEGLGARMPAQLSGGQRQRVALARTLAVEPRLLLLDEPFGALDRAVREELRVALRRIHDMLGMTTLFVTHDHEEAAALADRCVMLERGRIAGEVRAGDRPAPSQLALPSDLAVVPASVSGQTHRMP